MDLFGESSCEVPLRLTRRVDELCDEYERRIAGGEEVDLASFVGGIEPQGRRRLLEEVLSVFVERLRREGCADPARTILDKNPDLRVEIEEMLAASTEQEETQQFEHIPGKREAPALTPRGKKSRGLRIRCPHCSNHVELIGDTPSDSVNCAVCGSTFSLVDRSTETRMAEALQKIDRFELISRLGIGGFGTVWRARDTGLDRTVAVKIPRHGQLTDAELEQFFREARSVAQLRHPNIVPVHDVGREGDAVFIVSDLIRGVSLADLLTGKRPTPRESAELCITIAKALDHAHRKGVIHRDLKPSNVMIDDDGTPYLMDFGLAKREAEEVTMSTDGQIIGTPAYMSPEQAAGQSDWVDRRTDIYSLGVILFELLTGELPFRGNAQMQVQQRLKEDAPNARSLNCHLHKDLATICAKCLEREPGQRYQTTKEVADELSRYLDQLPIKARPLSPPERVVRWATRRPMQAIVAGLVLFLAVAGPTTALQINRQRSRLGEFVDEQANLIRKRDQENREAIARLVRLQDQLDVWEGRANPWKFWPPNPAEPPKKRQLNSLLAARANDLMKTSDAEVPVDKAKRLLALATLRESANDLENAERILSEAAEVLKDLKADDSQSVNVSVALAECYERLSAIVSERDQKVGNEWLAKAVAVRQAVAEKDSESPLLAALAIDAAVRSGAALGFDDPVAALKDAKQREVHLGLLWPKSTDKIYRIACLLAGRTPWLDENLNGTELTVTAPRD